MQEVGQEIVQFCNGCALALAVLGKVLHQAGQRCGFDGDQLPSKWKKKLEQFSSYAKKPGLVPYEYNSHPEVQNSQRRCIYGAIELSLDDPELKKDETNVHLPALKCVAFAPFGHPVDSRVVHQLWRIMHPEFRDNEFDVLMESLEDKNLVTISAFLPLCLRQHAVFSAYQGPV